MPDEYDLEPHQPAPVKVSTHSWRTVGGTQPFDFRSVSREPDENTSCVRCGYTLYGLDSKSECPECGTPIEVSMQGNLLVHAAPEYVRQLRTGITTVLLALILYIFLAIPGAVAASYGPAGLETAIIAVISVIGLVSLWGWWVFTSRDPGLNRVDREQPSRLMVRLAVCVSAATLVVGLILSIIPGTYPELESAVGLTQFAAIAFQFFAGMSYIIWIGVRLERDDIIDGAEKFRWIGPLLMLFFCLIITVLVALVWYIHLLCRVREALAETLEAQELA